MEERRKWQRHPISYPIEDEVFGEIRSGLVDVSQGGIGYMTSQRLAADDRVDLKLFLKKRMFRVKAKVVRVDSDPATGKNSIGAEFFDLPEDFHCTLAKEIEEITHEYRESALHGHRDISFRGASSRYLSGKPLEGRS